MRRTALPACILGLLLAAPVHAEKKTYELTISAGKHERKNTPVTVLVQVPAALAKLVVAQVEDPGGKITFAQLTAPSLLAAVKPNEAAVPRELHLILPELKAGASITLKATLDNGSIFGGQSYQWADTPGQFAELSYTGKPVLRYMYKALDETSKESREQTYKIFHHVYDPTGTRLVTKGPGGLYTHHRGLFFGFNKVTYGDGKKTDVWHCTNGAYQSHEKFLASEANLILGRHRLAIDWHGQNKEVFAHEERELTAYHVPDGTLIEFASRVRTHKGPIKLDGDPQHAGFHFRADQEVAAVNAKQTYFLRPDGAGKPGETRNWTPKVKIGINLPWNAMSFVLDKQRYTAGYLDRPGNPKEARYSERDYGRFGSYFEYEITENKPLEVNYRVWLQKGEMTGAEMERLSADFVEPVTVTVR